MDKYVVTKDGITHTYEVVSEKVFERLVVDEQRVVRRELVRQMLLRDVDGYYHPVEIVENAG